MFNMDKQKERFKDHIATFTDLGNIKIVDFKKPDSCDYRIRFLFEEDYCRLHITGDIGDLIASNYNNMTYEKFGDFVNNPSYFKGKIDCTSRELYEWDSDYAYEDLRNMIEDYDVRDAIIATKTEWDADTDDDYINEYIDDLIEDYGEHGLSQRAIEKIQDDHVYYDFWEIAGSVGRRYTGIIDLYLMAFRLAKKQIDEGVSE